MDDFFNSLLVPAGDKLDWYSMTEQVVEDKIFPCLPSTPTGLGG